MSEPSSPDLAGEAFFALAVDPRDRENLVAATTLGLYRRVPQGSGQFHWTQLKSGVFASVVVAAAAGATRFYSAQSGQDGTPSKVLHSDDGGAHGEDTGTAFPAGAGRIALGVQSNNPNLVYAFVTKGNGALQGVYRLEGVKQKWKRIDGIPNVLPGGQGSYDLTIAIDPLDANLIYLGGDRMDTPPWGGSVWRCAIQPSGSAFKVKSSASIGTHAHADVHMICHTPNEPNELWCTSDGGVFLNRNPRANGEFVSQNNGLACICSNFIGQHPTDPNILFAGMQDNGTARTASGPIWNHVGGGDGGYCLVNWAKPNRVLIYMNGSVHRSTTDGKTEAGWSLVWNFNWATMTQPIVSPPLNSAKPSDADVVAIGAGQIVFVSDDFATSWPMQLTLPGGAAAGDAFALGFASRNRLFMGTTTGRVFRCDRSGNTWPIQRIDNVAAGPLGVSGLISDIAVDWSDNNHNSVYVAFGGMGDTSARVAFRRDALAGAQRHGHARSA